MPVRMVQRSLRLLREPIAGARDHSGADTQSGGSELRVTHPVTICRPRHRLEGTTVSVIGVCSAGLNNLKAKVRAPDKNRCRLPSSYTGLGAPAPAAPRLAGESPDFFASRDLVRTLVERCEAGDAGRSATGAGGVE